jgi:hypothetical protein
MQFARGTSVFFEALDRIYYLGRCYSASQIPFKTGVADPCGLYEVLDEDGQPVRHPITGIPLYVPEVLVQTDRATGSRFVTALGFASGLPAR